MMRINKFQPPWWLQNCHLQSLLGVVMSSRCSVPVVWEQLDLPDGDFIDLCWAGNEGNPIVVLLHGLEGSSNSHYIQLMMQTLAQNNFHVVVMHFRSCSGRMNRLARSYHASETRDFEYFLEIVQRRYPEQPIMAIGFSLGGNVLLHHLAKQHYSILRAAVGVSIPFEIGKSARSIPTVYRWGLLRSMKYKSIKKVLAGQPIPATIEEIKKTSSFYEFDNLLTAPLNGFTDADDYYACSTVRPLLKNIKHNTLVIHAKDDPFIPPNSIPHAIEFANSTRFELHDRGGHVGFLEGDYPWSMQRWFQTRILEFLKSAL